MSFNDVAIVSAKGNGYRIYLSYVSNTEDIFSLKNADLNKKVSYYKM